MSKPRFGGKRIELNDERNEKMTNDFVCQKRSRL